MATLEKLAGSKVKMTIEVPMEQFEAATQKAYIKTVGKYNMPGFRKGKAPRKVIENMYGPLVFFDDAFDIVYPDVYRAAIEEHGIEPVGRPDVSIDDLGDKEENKPVVFSVEVAVVPEVKLGQYKGIEVSKQEYNVTDDMVEAAIRQEQEKVARFVDVDRPVEKGDTVNLDYSGSVDGVKFDGGTAQGQQLVIGSNSFIPGFEEQMVGMKVEEEKDLAVKFPEEYHAEELKGKDAVFHVKVNGIQVKELPALDDDFAKDISEFDTLDQLRDDKRRGLVEQAEKDAKIARENEVIKQVVDNAEVEIPDAMIERQLDYMVQDIAYRLGAQGMNLEDYLKFTGSSVETMRGEFREDAATRVKSQLVLETIAKEEKLEAAEEEIDDKLKEFVERTGRSLEDLKKSFSDEDKAYFRDQIVMDKTIAVMVDSAVEVEKKAEAPAKKKAAKKKAESTEPAEAE